MSDESVESERQSRKSRRKLEESETTDFASTDAPADDSVCETLLERPARGPRQRAPKSIRHRLMDLLSRRNHSEFELRQKLSPDYLPSEVDEAIEFARKANWLLPAEELAEQVAQGLSRRRKGHAYIDEFLKARGLPPVAKDSDEEIRKGLDLVNAKLAEPASLDYEEQSRIKRLLANRGFDPETIERVIEIAIATRSVATRSVATRAKDNE